jgi:AraC-like DNA-binding protein
VDYKIIQPSPVLKPYIQFYGLLQENKNGKEVQDIIAPYPSNGLIFPLNEQPDVWVHNEHFNLRVPFGYFMPQNTMSYQLTVRGRFGMLAVFFRPGMYRRFFSLPPAELTNQMVTFEDASCRDLLELQQRLLEPRRIRYKVALMENYLKVRYRRRQFQEGLIDHVMGMYRMNPLCRLEEVKNELNISYRYLRKTFHQQIGLSPKLFSKISRFSTAFQLLQSGRFDKLTDLAYQLGYYDQSHFIREFKYFTRTTPLQFSKEDHPLYNQIYWREGSGG